MLLEIYVKREHATIFRNYESREMNGCTHYAGRWWWWVVYSRRQGSGAPHILRLGLQDLPAPLRGLRHATPPRRSNNPEPKFGTCCMLSWPCNTAAFCFVSVVCCQYLFQITYFSIYFTLQFNRIIRFLNIFPFFFSRCLFFL